ncbi:MAG: hypothetical protein DMD54_17915 [Gemmatimonadetes bacterium]|nr:MAG: hypothetical protein DMD54_17915 [Gemmatimonadota bacterium]
MNQVVGTLALLDESPHADLQRLAYKARVVETGEQDHGTGRRDARDLPRGIHAVEHRHGHVQDRDIGRETLDGVHRRLAVGLVGHDFQAATLQQLLEGLAQHEVIVGEDAADRVVPPPSPPPSSTAVLGGVLRHGQHQP